MRCIQAGILLLLAGWAAAASDGGARLSADLECVALGGYHSNPVYVSAADKAGEASALWEGRLNADLRFSGWGNLAFHSGLDGAAEGFPSNAGGDAAFGKWSTEAFWFPLGRRKAGAKRKEMFLAAAYKLEATDNTVLSNPDRFDEELPGLGRLIQRTKMSGNLPMGLAGVMRIDAAFDRLDYGESPSLLATLDNRTREYGAGWESRRFAGAQAEIGFAWESRDYDGYPARDIFGDTVSGSAKRYSTMKLSAAAGYASGKSFDLDVNYGLDVQSDRYAGYFDAVTHAFGTRLKVRPGRAIQLSAGGGTAFKSYSHYRSYYNPARPLKKIRSDHVEADLEYGLGRYSALFSCGYRNESNPVPRYEYRAIQIKTGIKANF